MDNLVFSETQYKKLQQEYSKQIPTFCPKSINKLNSIISSLKINGFQLPIELQNNSLNKLAQAKELLNILHISNTCNDISLSDNPFDIISSLSEISIDLNRYNLKNIYQIICIKSNNLILETINQISNYFKNKNIKIFKYS